MFKKLIETMTHGLGDSADVSVFSRRAASCSMNIGNFLCHRRTKLYIKYLIYLTDHFGLWLQYEGIKRG